MKNALLPGAATLLFLVVCLSPHAARARALLTYSFDDGNKDNLVAVEVFGARGQVGALNVIADRVRAAANTGGLALSADDLRMAQAAGWEICSHSLSHTRLTSLPVTYADEIVSGWTRARDRMYTWVAPYRWPLVSLLMQDGTRLRNAISVDDVEAVAGRYYLDAANGLLYVRCRSDISPETSEMRAGSAEREIRQSREDLRSMGLDVRNFAAPYNDIVGPVRDLVRTAYDSGAIGFEGLGKETMNVYPLADRFNLIRVGVGSVTLDQAKELIHQAAQRRAWLILTFHHTAPPPPGQSWAEGWWTDRASLEELADYVITYGVEVVTQRQGIAARRMPIALKMLLLR